MSGDMNDKRKEKIEGFKLHINEEVPAEENSDAAPPIKGSADSESIINEGSDDSPIEPISRQDKIESFKLHIDSLQMEDYDRAGEVYRGEQDNMYTPRRNSFDINSSSVLQNIDQSMIIADDDFENSGDSIQSYSTNALERRMTPEEKAEYKKACKADKLRLKNKSRKNRLYFRLIWFVMVILMSVIVGGYMVVGINDMLAVGRTDEEVTIDIPENASLEYVSDILYKNKIINNENFFKLYATVTKSTSGFVKGTYDIKTNLDYLAIITYLQSNTNRTDIVEVQFTEGLNVREYSELLEKKGVCSASEFLNACNSDSFDEEFKFLGNIKNKSDRYYKLEGYLFPDTYYFYQDEDVESVIRKLLNNYERKIYHTKSRADGFDKRVTIEERAKAAGMTVDEVMILASIIQAESADADDMYKVSSVLHNRLNTAESGGVSPFGDMGLTKLQVDSTVYYPYKSKTQIPIAEKNSFKSKYDTYDFEGLPAGAICNPGSDAIDAALVPDETDYYYFCHKAATSEESVQSYFATTNAEHEQNLMLAGLAKNTTASTESSSETGNEPDNESGAESSDDTGRFY